MALGKKRRFLRAMAQFFLILLPSALILGAMALQSLLPGYPKGSSRRPLLQYGDYTLGTYRTPQGQLYYDLSTQAGGRTRVLIDRVYAYSGGNGNLYVRGVTGAAVVEIESGQCRLYTDSHYAQYRHSYPGVTLVSSIKAFPPQDYERLFALADSYPAYAPAPAAQAVLGHGRFAIEETTGGDGYRRLQLVDRRAREMDQGYTVRLLTDVESFLLQDGVLYVRSRDGYACLKAKGEDFSINYQDYGSKIYFSTLPDIDLLRNPKEFPRGDWAILQQLYPALRT